MTRSSLYVPGDRPARFDKALASGADAVILDLEDGVSADKKTIARSNVCSWLGANGTAAALVRVNSGNTGDKDIEALRAVGLPRLVVPKATPETCAIKGAVVVALIETAEGVARIDEIAQLTQVRRIAIGEADLAEDLGMWPSHDGREFATIRAQIVVASAHRGLEAPAGPVPTDIEDLEALEASSDILRRTGFGGRSVIHPRQVEVVNRVFEPSTSEIEWARGVLSADRASGGQIAVYDGGFVDAPIVARARRILDRVGEPNS
jgi:citrate lyase subunit beta/citryl-CoA lyase